MTQCRGIRRYAVIAGAPGRRADAQPAPIVPNLSPVPKGGSRRLPIVVVIVIGMLHTVGLYHMQGASGQEAGAGFQRR